MKLGKNVTFRLDEETLERLDALAKATNRSRAQVIRLLLDAVVPIEQEEEGDHEQ
jgi:predicted transcriptional regulator